MGNENKKGDGLFERKEKSSYDELKDDISDGCKCSMKTRVMGFVICFAIGWIISLFSTIVFIIKQDTTIFAIFYSLGQICNITG